MTLAEFERLLKETIGLDAASIGSATIERAIHGRRLVCGFEDVKAYWHFMRASGPELQELIEAVVVPETWFFRDREAFTTLGRLILEAGRWASARKVLRLLSVPASTGEEPYSMAMALLDAGLPAGCFQIDALDISGRALARAERAVYGRNSFRGGEFAFRDRYFEPSPPHGYRLVEAVRQQVRFQQGNLFTAESLSGAETYDVIFCRNLLIYFDRATQDRAVAVLTRLLAAKGWLFVGASETGLYQGGDFVAVNAPHAFAFHKAGRAAGETKPPGAPRYKRRPAAAPLPVVAAAPLSADSGQLRGGKVFPAGREHPPLAGRTARARSKPPFRLAGGLDEAARLADQGRLVEAAKACEADLRARGPSAEAFCLLGMVRDASGNPAEAAGYYRKALYLDPAQRDALVHLALLLEKTGDPAAAERLHARARRLEPKS